MIRFKCRRRLCAPNVQEFLILPPDVSVTPLKLKLAQLDAADLTDEWYRRARRILRGGDGGEHGLLLYKLARAYAQRDGPLVALDVGTSRGFSAMSMARAVLDAEIDGHVHTLDVFDHDDPHEWHIAKQRDDQLEGAPPMSRSQIWQRWFAEESVVVSPITGRSLDILEAWPHGAIDLAFLDGSHAYVDVKGELEMLDSLMAQRCAIVMDDYHLGVVAARVRSRPLNLAAWGVGRCWAWCGKRLETPLPGLGKPTSSWSSSNASGASGERSRNSWKSVKAAGVWRS